MANEAAILLLCFSFVLDTKGHSLRDGEWQICAADLCYCDTVFVAEERASEKDDVGKAQKSYVLL